MRFFVFFLVVCLESCNRAPNSKEASIQLDQEDYSSLYKDLMDQRRGYMLDQNKARLDTAYNLIEKLRESGDADLKQKAEQLKIGFLFASCDFRNLKEFLPEIDSGVLDYDLQKKVYKYYCDAKLDDDSISAVEDYEKATKFVLRQLKEDQSSIPAAMDLLYIKHNYLSEERLVSYIDSINDTYDNVILNQYDGSSYYEYSLQVNCKVPSYKGG